MMSRPLPALRRVSGFSLLEVLVAFVILAMVMGTLMQIFQGGLRNASLAGEYQQAVLLGQSKLATLGVELPLKPAELNGQFDSNFRWQMSIRPYIDTEQPSGAQSGVPAATPPVDMLDVEMKVLWGDTSQPRAVTLKTLKLVNRSSV